MQAIDDAISCGGDSLSGCVRITRSNYAGYQRQYTTLCYRLMRFMGCAYATTLDLARLRGDGPEPRADSEDAALLQKQVDAHEAAHLARLSVAGREIVEIARGNLTQNAATTCAALAAGPDVVFQGAFLSGNWGGWCDFLERVERH